MVSVGAALRWASAVQPPSCASWSSCQRHDAIAATHYQVYDFLPRNRHVAGKGSEVNRNEGVHSQLRDRLRRLQRKTKGYTKSLAMLRGSVALVYLKLNLI